MRTSSSFAEGVKYLGCEPFDLIILDQGSRRFEGQKVLAQAMEVDVELRVLVLTRSYNQACHLKALQRGALDYLEGPLGMAEIIALLETFTPCRSGPRGVLAHRVTAGNPKKENVIKTKSN